MLGDVWNAKVVEAPRGREVREERFVERVRIQGIGTVRDPRDGGQPGLVGRIANCEVGAVDLLRVAYEQLDVGAR